MQWKLTYIDKLMKGEDSIHSVFGSAMHDTIQQWLDIVFNRSIVMARTIDLSDLLKERMIVHFKRTTIEDAGHKMFVCDVNTLMEFYKDGVEILKHLQANMDKYFDASEWTLEGVELRLNVPVKTKVSYRGYLDIVLRHKLTGEIKIIDLKTSTKGWNHWKKDDPIVKDQLLIYKKFYAEKHNIPENAISVDFYILRRKLPTVSDWPIPRVSRFTPSNGKPSMNKMNERFKTFIDACFDDEGEFLTEQKATPSRSACRFCPYNQTDHCSVGVKV